jgi:hypothetical protein
MSGDQRLDRLYPALTAKERGLLVLRAHKAGEQPDQQIYHSTPDTQAREFNRLIRLMNALNVELATVLQILNEQIHKLEMKHAWLQTLRFWADDVGSLRVLVGLNMKEPITTSEYARREAEAREEWLPLSEWAQIVAEDHRWVDDDYVTDKDGEREVSNKAWNRVYRATQKELEQLVADGTLPARLRGRGVLVPAGAFYDWRGEPTPVYPEDVWEFDIRPDDQAEQVAEDRRAQAAVRRILDRAPKPLSKPADLSVTVEQKEGTGFGTEVEHALVISICDLVRQHWCEARAMEVAVAEVAEEFDGEDPFKADTRSLLDGCLDSCRQLRDEMADYVEIELPEPGEDDVAQVRRLIAKVVDG